MDGILEFMEDNMKKYKPMTLFFIIFISFHSYGENLIKNVYISDKGTTSFISQREVNPIILVDSIVIKSKSIRFNNISEITRVGSFVFEKNPNKLKKMLNDIQVQSTDSSSYDSNYRLVEILGKNNLITDGSFIIFFKDPSDKRQLNIDYNLLPKYEMPYSTSYRSNNFKTLQSLIDNIKNDSRVKSIELDLIDPFIQTQ